MPLDEGGLRDQVRAHLLACHSLGELQQPRREDELDRFRLGFEVEHRALQERVELRRRSSLTVDGRPRPPLGEPGIEAADAAGNCGSSVGSTVASSIAPCTYAAICSGGRGGSSR